MRTRSWLSLLLGTLLLACQGDGPREVDGEAHDSFPDPGAPPAERPAPGGEPRTVTLITGDRITVAGKRVTIQPAAGRTRRQFKTHHTGDHLHVVPGDAEPLIASGQLDPRLFDVTELLALDYDDAQRDDLPLIVIHQPGVRPSGLLAAGARSIRRLASVNGEAMRAPKRAASAIWRQLAPGSARAPTGVARIWLDGKRRLLLDHSAAQIGAPAAWAAGWTGAGVTIAVLDTGIDADHPDFAGRIAGAQSFIDGVPEAVDDDGHGTHVASIAAGSGAGGGGQFRGIAPDATLLVGKVCAPFGCPESSILAGMEWAAESGAAVVNLSLGGVDSPGDDPLEQAINELTAQHGTLFVAASGNRPLCGGADRLQVGSPSTADAALSVGAVDPADRLASFSCRGPRAGDRGLKPEITAPGVRIAAARVPGTPTGDIEPIDELYTRVSGTSMAAPHVTGAAAVLRQQHPDWRAVELKSALMGSASPNPAVNIFHQGAGRVDVARAIAQELNSSPATLSFGIARWPHDDDEPIARAIEYRNHGDAAVTVQLALDVTGPDGAPPPAGMFTIEPAALTIPAGGQASATITADTRVVAAEGVFTGALVATAGGEPLRTLLIIDREVESYDLALTYIDRQGQPAAGATTVVNLATGEPFDLGLADGEGSGRVPRGDYVLSSSLAGSNPDATFYVAGFVQPLLEVSGPSAVTLDARTAARISIHVPEPTATRSLESVLFARHTAVGVTQSSMVHFGGGGVPDFFDGFYTAHLGPEVPPAEFTTLITSDWAEPGPGADHVDSPYSYDLVFVAPRGRFPTGFERSVENSELAAVHAEYRAQAPERLGFADHLGFPGFDEFTSFSETSVIANLPGRRTEFYSTEPGIIWLRELTETTLDFFPTARMTAFSLRSFEPGERLHERWNGAVFGPSFNEAEAAGGAINRFGNTIEVLLGFLHNDSADHLGDVNPASGHTRLFRDGELVGESPFHAFGFFEVPPEPADYRLETGLVRVDQDDLSTRLDVAWRFRSQEAPGDAPASLPLFAVRFAPFLDGRNAAPGGRVVAVPISISRQVGGASRSLRRLTVQASYDRGATWRPALVIRFGDFAVAFLHHPDGEGTVSLRASATDRDDNRVDQTIIDAYRLRE